MDLTLIVLGDKVIQIKSESNNIEKIYIKLNEKLKSVQFITDLSLSNDVIHIVYHPLKAMKYYKTHQPLNSIKEEIKSIIQNSFNDTVDNQYGQLHLLNASFYTEVVQSDVKQLFDKQFKAATFGYYPEEVIVSVELSINDNYINETIDVQPNDIYYTDMGIHLVTKSYTTKGVIIGRIESTIDEVCSINVLDLIQFERLEA